MKTFLTAVWLAIPGIAAASALTGQDALYSLTLAKVRTHDVTGAAGQMRFSVVDGCTGWGTTQHMTLLIRNADGSLNKTVTDYITWETKDGSKLTFTLRERDNDGKETLDDSGVAVHTGSNGGGTITYSTPAGTVLSMPPGTLFPMAHTEALIAAGHQGKKFISVPLFDGTTADGAQHTFVALLGQPSPGPNTFPALSNMPSTNVDIAFYERKNDDENPDFRSQMRYFDNGVATDIVLDFGDFIMDGKLLSVTVPAAACSK
jgi:hypothetical protein